jgi:succinate dehydrogenase / fumarate reductase membrane anchor subunit
MSLRSPLSKALGSGSAGHGFSHWWWQRLSAVALIPLTLWLIYSILCLVGADYQTAIEWLAKPLNATLMLVFVIAMLFHAQTGLQVVIEDYIHTKWLNLSTLMLVKFAALILVVWAAISIFSIV